MLVAVADRVPRETDMLDEVIGPPPMVPATTVTVVEKEKEG
jgi:hypothetical protein